MPVKEQRIRVVTPEEADSHRFQKIGSEEVHTVESFERKVHGPDIEVNHIKGLDKREEQTEWRQ
jgi:hypothetical protein